MARIKTTFFFFIIIFLLFSCFENKRTNAVKHVFAKEEEEAHIIIISPVDLSIDRVTSSQYWTDETIRIRRSLSLNDPISSNLLLKMYLENKDKYISSLDIGSYHTGNFSDFTLLLDFKKLETLIIDNELLTDISGITVLAELEELTSLTIWAKRVTDIRPLSAFVNLKKLNIEVSKTCDDASVLLPLVNLESLSFWHASSESISGIAQLLNLEELGFRFATEKVDILPLRNLYYLKTLCIKNYDSYVPKYEELDLTPLKYMINLESLEIEGFTITDVNPLLSLPNLVRVNFMFSEIDEHNVMLLRNETNASIYTKADRDH
jgi:hypothetical protein